ncbi:MAG: NADH-quinone oxidoreductase subunit A [Candidatus Bipolaricaulia bacterium]
MSEYLPVAFLAVFGGATIFAALYLANRLTPRRPSSEKLSPYECGERPIGDTRIPIEIKYYLYVLIFLVMDVEVVFLLPWALAFDRLGRTGFVEMILFILILLIGWGYAWRRGALRWLEK